MQRNKSSGKRKWIDPDDAPELTREFFRAADAYEGEKLVRRGRPPAGERPKEAVELRLSPDVLDHFRAGGTGMANAHQRRAGTRGIARKEKGARMTS
jgi:uncharacterized protein (DUF4415 family)